MNRIALIIPYFGALPNYFSLWLKSAGNNRQIDFLLFTDCDMNTYNVPQNVKCISMTFNEVKQRVAKLLDFSFVLHNPYKLCDYKPLYGLIFSDYLNEYEFWGHCDPDVIWGNLSHFIVNDLLEKYDRLYRRGHLCIYRNSDRINRAPLQKLKESRISYKDVYGHRYSAHYDEGDLIEALVQCQGGNQWNEDDFADVSYFYKQFVLVKQDKLCETVAAFRWKDGWIFGLGINGDLNVEKEYSYVHLQKRKMCYESEKLGNDFLITPDKFIPYTENWKQLAPEWERRDAEFEKNAIKNNRKNQIKNVREGALYFRVKRLI